MTGKKISSDILSDKLQQYGWQESREKIDGHTYITFMKNGYSWRTPRVIVHYPLMNQAERKLITDKVATYELVMAVANVPEYVLVASADDTDQVLELIQRYGSVVAKPYDGSGSEGITMGIDTPEKLKMGIETTLEISKKAIVQRQLEGTEFRFTFLDHQLVSVIEKQPAILTGDGEHTLQELIETENQERERVNDHSMVTYPNMTIPKGKDPARVLDDGEIMVLSESSLVRNGTSLYEHILTIDESYKLVAQSIADLFEARFMVVDMFIKDVDVPAAGGNYWFLECNGGPALAMYESLRSGRDKAVINSLCRTIDSLAN